MRVRNSLDLDVGRRGGAARRGSRQAFNIVFDGPDGFGISAASAAGAEADGVPLLVVDQISTAVSLGLAIPDPEVLFFDLVGNPSVANPHTATSRWTVNKGGGALNDGWLVFLGPRTPRGTTPRRSASRSTGTTAGRW